MRSTHWDKIAPDYFEHVDSPFHKDVKNPIYAKIREIPDRKRKTVLEIGTGTGTLLKFLSRNFKQVVAFDISYKMIEVAKENNKELKNVEYLVLDAVNISKLRRKFDVVVAVNSILMPNIAKINKILKKVHSVLKRGGYFVGIFPSFDSMVYQALICYDREYHKTKNRAIAKRRTSSLVSVRHHDFCYGFIYNTCAEDRQKHFYGFELEYRLKNSGFKRMDISKVYYPWGTSELIKDVEHFKKNPKTYSRLWDWVVTARP